MRTTDDNADGCVDSAAAAVEPRYLLALVYDLMFMYTPIKC
jgi:hypothetical protein